MAVRCPPSETVRSQISSARRVRPMTPEESPHPPSPSRQALHAVVLCAWCSVTGARCWALRCDVGNRTPDARPSRRRMRLWQSPPRARCSSLGLPTPRLVDQLCLPIRFLDRRVQLPPLLCKVIRSLSQSANIDRPHDPQFGFAIAGLRRACRLCHLMERRLEQPEVVAPRESVGHGSAIRDCRREVRLVDSSDQRFEFSSNGF